MRKGGFVSNQFKPVGDILMSGLQYGHSRLDEVRAKGEKRDLMKYLVKEGYLGRLYGKRNVT